MPGESRKVRVKEGAALVLPPSLLSGAREIEVEQGGLLVARDDLTPEQIKDILAAWKARAAVVEA